MFITTWARVLMIAIGAGAGIVVLAAIAVDMGEIVVITTTDEKGRTHETQLWVADLDGAPYLRAGRPDAAWLMRLRASPRVEVERGDEVHEFRALPQEVDSMRARLNEAMGQKYGFADRMMARFLDREHSVPIRLAPVPALPSVASPHPKEVPAPATHPSREGASS